MTLLAPLALLAAIAGVGWGVWESRRRREIERRLEREREALRNAEGLRLAEAEIRQQAVFNSMVEGLLVLDQQSRVLYVNPALGHLFLLPNPVRGLSLIEALRLHELEALTQRVLAEGRVTGFEVQLPGPPSRILQVNAATVRDPDQALIGTILVFHDLTRIQQLENVRKEFVANVSHELRTPLSLIKGYVETLLDGAKDDPALTGRFLQTIERHADRLTFLIDDLLAISQLESGHVAYNLQAVDLRAQVERVCSELEVRARERQVVLLNEVPADLWVRADGDRLQQVLLNLIDNAIKYGRTGGVVRIGGRVVADAVVEGFVSDDGPGIPPESQPRVFERFYRVDRARSREQGGTGLGLSIVKHIIQAHGGEVDVESQPGRGTTFRFTLPRAEAPAAFPDPVDEGDPAPVTEP